MYDLSVGRSVCLSVCLSSALWKNGGTDPDEVWHRRSDGSRTPGTRDEAQSREWVDGSWVMGQMGHENRMGHMGHGSLGVDP